MKLLYYFLLFLILCFAGIDGFAQNKNKLNISLKAKGLSALASIQNTNIFPYIVGMEAYKDEMRSKKIFNALLTVEPKSTVEVNIPDFDIENKERNIYLEYSHVIGRTNIKQRKNIFRIPFQKDTSILVCQSPDGPLVTHQDKPYAIDFCVPENTPILAAREGVVIEVVQEFKESGWKKELKNKANYINILHDDGFITRYIHLTHMGARVSVGDQVKIKQIIGHAGMTGFANGPHLHFELLEPKEGFIRHQSFFQVINPLFVNDAGKSIDLTYKKNFKVDE
jgi:murein DD-endopeptidase MepM/ murein hydrolase activator NlpD